MNSESSAFHTAIFDALCACFNLNPDSRAAFSLIHEAYAEPENAPRPPRNRNMIYWTVLQDYSTDPVSVAYGMENGNGGGHTPVVCSTLKYQLVIVCYGPACEENALCIRSMLYLDGSGFPRKILRDAGIFPVPDPPQPSLFHEEEGSLWRKRADLTVSLRVRAVYRGPEQGAVQSVPPVILHKSL